MQIFSDNKAGMVGIDKERIQKIIDENTSTNYDGHAKKRKMRIDARIKSYNETISTLSMDEIKKAEIELNSLINELEKERDLSRTIVHLDMDAFYAAVEMRDDASLRNIPMAVGSDSMLSTSNYAARRFGVRAAMPGFIARKLCPELKIIRCNFQKYRKASYKVSDVIKDYDPNYHMASLDEAYMDITDYLNQRASKGSVSHVRIRYTGDCICRLPIIAENEVDTDAIIDQIPCQKCNKLRKIVKDCVTFGTNANEVVKEMRFRVEQATGLTCSAGIAPNSMIAKTCSDLNKPNGQFSVPNEKECILNFMRNLPIRKVSGIGPVTEAILMGIGVKNCGDIFEKRGIISKLFTKFNYGHFLRIALGIGHRHRSDEDSRRKSISNEKTFHPTSDTNVLFKIAENLCNDLIDSLPDHGIKGGSTMTVKMKFSTFDVVTRCCSVNDMFTSAERLQAPCEKFIKQEICNGKKQLRLIGVRLSRLVFDSDKTAPTKPLQSFWKLLDGPLGSNVCDETDKISSCAKSSTQQDVEMKTNESGIEMISDSDSIILLDDDDDTSISNHGNDDDVMLTRDPHTVLKMENDDSSRESPFTSGSQARQANLKLPRKKATSTASNIKPKKQRLEAKNAEKGLRTIQSYFKSVQN